MRKPGEPSERFVKQAHPAIRSTTHCGQTYSSWTQWDKLLFPISIPSETSHFRMFACAVPATWNTPPCPPPPYVDHQNTTILQCPWWMGLSIMCIFHNFFFFLLPWFPDVVWLCPEFPHFGPFGQHYLILSFIATLSSCFILPYLSPPRLGPLQGQDPWFILSCIPRTSVNAYWLCNNTS